MNKLENIKLRKNEELIRIYSILYESLLIYKNLYKY
jgi:hypothetical protein